MANNSIPDFTGPPWPSDPLSKTETNEQIEKLAVALVQQKIPGFYMLYRLEETDNHDKGLVMAFTTKAVVAYRWYNPAAGRFFKGFIARS